MRDNGNTQWSGELTLFLAAVGYAIGLGNIWRFSYVVGENGGGGFVVIYIVCMFLVGLPLLLSDFLIGRYGGGSPPHCMQRAALASGSSGNWRAVGWLGILACFVVLSYYSVIAGWTMAYFTNALTMPMPASYKESSAAFEGLLADPLRLSTWHSLFIGAVGIVSALGVTGGIERFMKVAMPLFFMILIGLVLYGLVFGDLRTAMVFLFSFRPAEIDRDVVMVATGQAFFSLGVGASVLMVYGAYIPRRVSLQKTALIIVTADTVGALLAGLAIFPLLFAAGLEPGQGPGLVFKTLPLAFSTIPGGQVVAVLFFLLLTTAAFTSAVGLVEPIVSWADEQLGARRWVVALLSTSAAWLLGFATVLSFNIWSESYPLGGFAPFAGKTVFDLLDLAVSSIMLPFAGLLVAVFSGWVLSESIALNELGTTGGSYYRVWRFLLRWFIPVLLVVLILTLLTS